MQVASPSSIAARASAAILGATLADAAAQPLHWIYDTDQLSKALATCADEPEFRPESANPFYKLGKLRLVLIATDEISYRNGHQHLLSGSSTRADSVYHRIERFLARALPGQHG